MSFLPFHDAQLGDKENEMPPKRKPNAKELRKALRDKEAKMKESEAKLANVQAANENKRGNKPYGTSPNCLKNQESKSQQKPQINRF